MQLVPHASAQPGSPRDIDAIISSGVLRVSTTSFDLPAFRWHEHGALVGPEADLINGIAKAMGVRIVLVSEANSFDEVVDLVAQGRADVGINKLSQTYARLQRVQFSIPYLTLRRALLYDRAAVARLSASRPPEESLRRFQGAIGAVRGTSYVDFGRRNFPGAQIVELPNWDAAIDALLGHRVDALYRDEFEILRTLQSHPLLNATVGAAILTDQKDFLSIAICSGCAKLEKFVDYHITQIQGTFTVRRLMAASPKP